MINSGVAFSVVITAYRNVPGVVQVTDETANFNFTSDGANDVSRVCVTVTSFTELATGDPRSLVVRSVGSYTPFVDVYNLILHANSPVEVLKFVPDLPLKEALKKPGYNFCVTAILFPHLVLNIKLIS
jgi:hypothetical protein